MILFFLHSFLPSIIYPLQGKESDLLKKVMSSLKMVSYCIENKFKLYSHPCSGPCLSLWPHVLQLSLSCLFTSCTGHLQGLCTNFSLCLKCSSPKYPHSWLLPRIQVLALMLPSPKSFSWHQLSVGHFPVTLSYHCFIFFIALNTLRSDLI